MHLSHVQSLSAHLIKSVPSVRSTRPIHVPGVLVGAEGLYIIDREMIVEVFPMLSNSALTTDWRLGAIRRTGRIPLSMTKF